MSVFNGSVFNNNFISPDTLKTVQDNQTIQSVIDSCPPAEGSLKDGFANPYVVRVPSGHEKEFYSLVRNAADEASDKRNVKVIFEDNPEEEFIVHQWDNMDAIGDWELWHNGAGSTVSIDIDHKTEGTGCLLVDSGESHSFIVKKTFPSEDWRGYQGAMIYINVNSVEVNFLIFYIYDSAGNHATSVAYTIDDGDVFFPFMSYSEIDTVDLSDIVKVQIYVSPESENTGAFKTYIDNIRLIRTFPYNVAIIRMDDGTIGQANYMHYLEEKGWRANLAIVPTDLCDSSHMTQEQLSGFYQAGHDVFSQSMLDSHFDRIDAQETYDSVAGMQCYLEYYGMTRASNLFANPYNSSNRYLVKYLRSMGIQSVYDKFGFPARHEGSLASAHFDISELDMRINIKCGGIYSILVHNISAEDETAFVDALSYIETHFSKVMLFSEVMKHFPASMIPSAQHLPKPYGRARTLSTDDVFHFWDGSVHKIDPGGANRKYIPQGEFQQWSQITVVNTADAAETLTFDPSFTTNGTHNGDAEASDLTDSSASWIVGQLVGRTITNTTDGSSGIIVSNTSDTIVGKLTGGTNNTWAVGDSYTITPVGLNQDIAQNERGTFAYDGEGWVKIHVG